HRRTARRKSAVYHPCDLISSLKNHCTPAACSAEPPFFSARRICVATASGVAFAEGITFAETRRIRKRRPLKAAFKSSSVAQSYAARPVAGRYPHSFAL